MARLDKLAKVLEDFRDGVEDHLTSQVIGTRGPKVAEKLAQQLADLADNIAHVAALELVHASHKVSQLREDAKSRIDVTVKGLDPKLAEDEDDLDELEEAVLKRIILGSLHRSLKLKKRQRG